MIKVDIRYLIQIFQKTKVPLDDYDFEKLMQRFDSSGKEGKINYQLEDSFLLKNL